MNKKGFTLIELLVTTAIIGLISTIGTVSYSYVRMKARDAKRASDVKTIRSGVETFYEQNNAYPAAPSGGLILGHPEAKVLSDAGFTPVGGQKGIVYLGNVPANILPGGLPYVYRTFDAGGNTCHSGCHDYEFTFSLESPVGELVAGPHKVKPDGIIGPENDPNYRPPSFLAQYVPSAEDIAASLGSVREIDKLREQVVGAPEIQVANQAVVAPASVVVAGANLTAAVATAVPAANAANVIAFFAFQPFLLAGRRKRATWGVVYHAGTKVPIDLATVRLIDSKTNRAVAVKVTDKDGRYAFTPRPGTYRIEVAKPGFAFPADSLAGAKDDGRYPDIYFGNLIRVDEEGSTLTLNIPIEASGEPDARMAAASSSRNKQSFRKTLALSGPVLGFVTLVVTPSVLMLLLFLLHLSVYFLFKRLAVAPEPKSRGVIYDEATRKPVEQAVVRILSLPYNKVLESRITDARGEYSFYVGNGQYYITVVKPGYVKTETSPLDFTAISKPTFIASDLPLRKAPPSVQ